MKAPMLLAVARHRGTEISNPFPSSREMSELRLWRKHTGFVGEPRRNRKPRRGDTGVFGAHDQRGEIRSLAKQQRDAAVHTHAYDFHNFEDRAAATGSVRVDHRLPDLCASATTAQRSWSLAAHRRAEGRSPLRERRAT